MIAFVRGELAALEKDKVILDVGGVGYGIFMPEKSMGKLPAVGSEIKLHTYLNVKEDAMQLFGFRTRDELEVFKLVLGVSGIGPKGALSILSQLSPDELRMAVMAGDVKMISSAQGIGKKTAEKLILELKDKLKLEDILEHTPDERDVFTADSTDMQSDAVQALVALGYNAADALRAVRQAPLTEDMGAEDILKAALKNLL